MWQYVFLFYHFENICSHKVHIWMAFSLYELMQYEILWYPSDSNCSHKCQIWIAFLLHGLMCFCISLLRGDLVTNVTLKDCFLHGLQWCVCTIMSHDQVKLLSQISHLNFFFPWWSDEICKSNLPFLPKFDLDDIFKTFLILTNFEFVWLSTRISN